MTPNFSQERKNLIALKISSAINDWPDDVLNYQDFLSQIKKLLKDEIITLETIQNYMNRASPLKSAWIFESFESLKEIPELENYSLNEIIEYIN